jgi:RecB family exonuclease
MQGRRSITGEMFEPWFNEIAEVVLSETSFASGKLKLAGTVDALVKLHDGTYQLVDFKTSIKEKTRSSCYDYFVQLGLYTLLLEEQLKIEIPTAAIFMLYYDIETLAPIKPLRFDTNEKQLTRQREKAYNRLDQFYMKYNDF